MTSLFFSMVFVCRIDLLMKKSRFGLLADTPTPFASGGLLIQVLLILNDIFIFPIKETNFPLDFILQNGFFTSDVPEC